MMNDSSWLSQLSIRFDQAPLALDSVRSGSLSSRSRLRSVGSISLASGDSALSIRFVQCFVDFRSSRRRHNSTSRLLRLFDFVTISILISIMELIRTRLSLLFSSFSTLDSSSMRLGFSLSLLFCCCFRLGVPSFFLFVLSFCYAFVCLAVLFTLFLVAR